MAPIRCALLHFEFNGRNPQLIPTAKQFGAALSFSRFITKLVVIHCAWAFNWTLSLIPIGVFFASWLTSGDFPEFVRCHPHTAHASSTLNVIVPSRLDFHHSELVCISHINRLHGNDKKTSSNFSKWLNQMRWTTGQFRLYLKTNSLLLQK